MHPINSLILFQKFVDNILEIRRIGISFNIHKYLIDETGGDKNLSIVDKSENYPKFLNKFFIYKLKEKFIYFEPLCILIEAWVTGALVVQNNLFFLCHLLIVSFHQLFLCTFLLFWLFHTQFLWYWPIYWQVLTCLQFLKNWFF